MNKIGKLHYISCPRGMLKPCRQMSKKRNTGYDFALNESKKGGEVSRKTRKYPFRLSKTAKLRCKNFPIAKPIAMW